MIDAGQFVQWINPANGEYYGTRKEPIDRAIAEGKDLVFDYVPEGYLNLKRFYPANTVGIFLMAPNLDVLISRLRSRASESPTEQLQRHQMALQDLNFVDQHDYHVINDDLGETLATLRAIRIAEKARLSRQNVLPGYLKAAKPALLRYY